jgi:hypothetical protein
VSVLRSPVVLSKAVVVLLGAVSAVDCAMLYGHFSLYRLMDERAREGRPASRSDLADDLLTSAVAVLGACLFLATAVVFIIWFHRVRANAGVFAPEHFGSGPGWAIGAWFIPVANAVIPCRIAHQTWHASRRDPYRRPGKGERPTLVKVWWLLWLVASAVDYLAWSAYDDAVARSFLGGADPVAVRAACLALVAAAVLDVVAALFAALFVRRLTAMQDATALRGPVPVAPAGV